MEAVFLCHVVDEGKVAERIQLGPCRGGGSLSLSRTIEFFFFFFRHLRSGVILDSKNTN